MGKMCELVPGTVLFLLFIVYLVYGSDPSFCGDKADGLYEMEGACTKYYQCFAGNTYPRDCGDGTYWNDVAKICGFDCVSSSGGGGGGAETTTTSTTTTPPETTTTSATTTTTTTTTTPPDITTTTTTTTTTPPDTTTTTTPETTTTIEQTTTDLETTETPVDIPPWACNRKILVPVMDAACSCSVFERSTTISTVHCLGKCAASSSSCSCVTFKKDVSSLNCELASCEGQTYSAIASPNTLSIFVN